MSYKSGDVIGVYRLTMECGRGTFGQVFLAENTISGQLSALKILSCPGKYTEKELEGLIRFRSCRHPNLMQIHHIDRIGETLYYTMPPADSLAAPGEPYLPDTLGNRLRTKGPMSAAATRQMLRELLAGLEELHRNGLCHRDIKPDNILWINQMAVLADIGSIRNDSSFSIGGTPGFMPDDVLLGRRAATPADDIHALGKVIYCVLSGGTADEFPRFPGKLSDPLPRRLFQISCAACSGKQPIRSTAAFRARLDVPEARRIVSRRTMIYALTTVLGFGGVISLYAIFLRQGTDAAIQKGRLSRPTEFVPKTIVSTKQVSSLASSLASSPAASSKQSEKAKSADSTEDVSFSEQPEPSSYSPASPCSRLPRSGRIKNASADLEEELKMLPQSYTAIMQRYDSKLQTERNKRANEFSDFRESLR